MLTCHTAKLCRLLPLGWLYCIISNAGSQGGACKALVKILWTTYYPNASDFSQRKKSAFYRKRITLRFQYQIQFARIEFDLFFSLFSLIFSLKTPFTKNKLAAASFHPLRNSLANLKYNRCRAKKGEQRNEHSFLVLSSLELKTKNRALNIFLLVVYTNS